MQSDNFILRDRIGTMISHRSILGHIKVDLDNIQDKEYPYYVKSETTGYEFHVTKDTKPEDWREFSDKCLMALD